MPVSFQTPSRFGPRNCGQSSACTVAVPDKSKAIPSVLNLRRQIRGPGLHVVVGRVPSRGVTRDLVYNEAISPIQAEKTTEPVLMLKVMPSLKWSFIRDAVEVRIGAEKDLAVGDGWGRVAGFCQIIHGQNIELFWVGPKNAGDASSAGHIQPPGGQHDGTPAFSSLEPLGPQDFPSLAVNALGGPRSGVDNVQAPINDDARTNPLRLFLEPEPIRCGYVAGPAEFEAHRWSIYPPRERDADSTGDDW